MIQDIAPHVFHNEYEPKSPNPESIILYFRDDRVLMREKEGQIFFPSYEMMLSESEKNRDVKLQYLFAIDDIGCYLAEEYFFDGQSGFHMEKISIFRKAVPAKMAFAGITGYQLYQWYQERRYCGKCGREMYHSEEERAMVCDHCGIHEYPKISPAVIVAVVNGDRILLSKYAYGVYKRYALLAGFTEVGETIEETVKREVFEEVGLRVKNLQYYKSQPWPFSSSLLMGFFVEVDGSDEIHRNEKELSEAGWFTREEIEIDDLKISLTNEMIRKFRDHWEEKKN